MTQDRIAIELRRAGVDRFDLAKAVEVVEGLVAEERETIALLFDAMAEDAGMRGHVRAPQLYALAAKIVRARGR